MAFGQAARTNLGAQGVHSRIFNTSKCEMRPRWTMTDASQRRPSAVVIGCGPVGAYTALHLARGGFHPVTVLEKRSQKLKAKDDPSTGVNRTRRSYSIVLNRRAIAALSEFDGLHERVLSRGVEITENISFRSKPGDKAPSRRKGDKSGFAVDRLELVMALVEHARDTRLDIDFCFQHRVDDVDFEARYVSYTNEIGKQDTISYDLLVVAQGVYSSVRQLAVDRGLIEYTGIPDNKQFKIADIGLSDNWHHPVQRADKSFIVFAAHEPMICMLCPPQPNPDKRYGIIVADDGAFEAGGCLEDRDAIRRVFAERFPQVFGERNPMTDNFINDLMAQKVSTGGITSVCNRFDIAGSAVLVGDCASSCWASLGQGFVQGVEGASVLAKCLDSNLDTPLTREQIAVALTKFTIRRKPDADAVGKLSMYAFGRNKRAITIGFVVRLGVLQMAHKLLGTARPALMQLADADVPYSRILKLMERQDSILDFSMQFGAVATVLVTAFVASRLLT